MAATATSETQEKRLLRLTVAHYRKEDCAEEDLYRWATEVYIPQAVKIHTKHGLEGFALVCISQNNTSTHQATRSRVFLAVNAQNSK
jgi:hypothetical protein